VGESEAAMKFKGAANAVKKGFAGRVRTEGAGFMAIIVKNNGDAWDVAGLVLIIGEGEVAFKVSGIEKEGGGFDASLALPHEDGEFADAGAGRKRVGFNEHDQTGLARVRLEARGGGPAGGRRTVARGGIGVGCE